MTYERLCACTMILSLEEFKQVIQSMCVYFSKKLCCIFHLLKRCLPEKHENHCNEISNKQHVHLTPEINIF